MSDNHSPETRRSLLVRIRDARDHLAWSEFVQIYAPLIHRYALRRGLQDADAADVAQQVLQSVARSIPGFQYDRSKGSFRGWLFSITKNQLVSTMTKASRSPQATGDTSFQASLAMQPADQEEASWNREHEQQLFSWAIGKVESEFTPTTWQAFWLQSVKQQPAAKVAEQLGISVGAAYIAKSRVIARLRDVIQSLEEE